MYNEYIKLINQTLSVNQYGDTVATTTERTVFVKVESVGQSEFYQAQAVGLKPEIKFIMSDYLDYEDEKYLKYSSYEGIEKTYKVLRTFRNDNRLELVCTRVIENASS